MPDDATGQRVQWRMHIPAAPEKVFAALDSDHGRASFWAEAAIERDGRIEFRFINGYTCSSEVLERDPPAVYAIDYMGGAARFEITPDGEGGSDLELTHEVSDPAEWAEIHAGWLNVLFPLKAWLAYGVDLRNHDPARTWDQGYADQ